MSYTLPPAVDVYWKSYKVAAAQIPQGAAGAQVAGFPFLQFNEQRIGLMLCNPVASTHVVWFSEREFGFEFAFPLHVTINGGVLILPWSPRNQLYAWKGPGGVPELVYVEFVYQPFRQGVSPEQGGGIRSNVQNV